VARRARPVDVGYQGGPASVQASGGHDGYARLRRPVIHRRTLRLSPHCLEIVDRLDGDGKHGAEIFFHLHPDVKTEQTEDKAVSLSVAGAELALLRMDTGWDVSEEGATYHPEFGLAVPNKKIVGRWAGSCPVRFVTRLELR
jgi:uncharacterized heparinase superfamily protein